VNICIIAALNFLSKEHFLRNIELNMSIFPALNVSLALFH